MDATGYCLLSCTCVGGEKYKAGKRAGVRERALLRSHARAHGRGESRCGAIPES
jgi:hypothetical protein